MNYKERLDAEMKNFEAVLNAKEKDIERLEREKKKFSGEKEELLENIRSFEKKIQDINLSL